MSDDEQIRRHLAALPRPAMPAEVTDRIHQRLAEETKVTPIAGGRRMTVLVAAAAVAGVMALVGLGLQPQTEPVPAQSPVLRAGAVFEPETFATQLRQRYLDMSTRTRVTATFADSPRTLQACTDAVSAQGRILGVDAGRYGRTEAVILITKYPADREYEEIWVVTPGCGPQDSNVIRHMLFDVDPSLPT